MIIRSGRTIFKSPPQQHDFNFPYQLGSAGGDSPTTAEVRAPAIGRRGSLALSDQLNLELTGVGHPCGSRTCQDLPAF